AQRSAKREQEGLELGIRRAALARGRRSVFEAIERVVVVLARRGESGVLHPPMVRASGRGDKAHGWGRLTVKARVFSRGPVGEAASRNRLRIGVERRLTVRALALIVRSW